MYYWVEGKLMIVEVDNNALKISGTGYSITSCRNLHDQKQYVVSKRTPSLLLFIHTDFRQSLSEHNHF